MNQGRRGRRQKTSGDAPPPPASSSRVIQSRSLSVAEKQKDSVTWTWQISSLGGCLEGEDFKGGQCANVQCGTGMHPPDFAVRGLRGEIRPRLNAARTGKKKERYTRTLKGHPHLFTWNYSGVQFGLQEGGGRGGEQYDWFYYFMKGKGGRWVN